MGHVVTHYPANEYFLPFLFLMGDCGSVSHGFQVSKHINFENLAKVNIFPQVWSGRVIQNKNEYIEYEYSLIFQYNKVLEIFVKKQLTWEVSERFCR